MTNSITGQPLTVQTVPDVPPFLRLPADQLARVSELMTQHQIRHEVSEFILSFDGGPAKGSIRFGWAVDPKVVQALLDSVA